MVLRISRFAQILTVATLLFLAVPAMVNISIPREKTPMMVSYNPPAAQNYHAPISAMGLVAVTNATPVIPNLAVASSNKGLPSSLQSIRQNALRFTTDNSYFPQTETSIAVDPRNTNHVLGVFNDQKFFFCGFLPNDCAGSFPASGTGFTTSTDGGKTVAKSSDIPDLLLGPNLVIALGDPSAAPSIDGNFFVSSLAFGRIGGDGIIIAKSNSNLFNSTIPCTTLISNATVNQCWSSVFIFGFITPFATEFEDKPLLSVDTNPASPFYGSVYVSWDHLFPNGTSASYLARCTNDLSSCTMLAGGGPRPLSDPDFFPSFTTPSVDKNGNVHVTWCNYGTLGTFGPVSCRIRSSPPGGTSFGPTSNILSFMGPGTTLPNATVTIGWATEQFRTISIPNLASDLSPSSNNLYFTIQVCISGHYYALPFSAPDNPGLCELSAVVFSRSTDGGVTWSSPITLSRPAVNDQPFVTVDSTTGQVIVVYYTTQFDPFNHRIDVVASISRDGGAHFRQTRVTSVSNEPDSDPNYYDYFNPSGRGGAFTVPQYGDYFQATAIDGMVWVLFTADYAVEAGTFQADPFLATLRA